MPQVHCIPAPVPVGIERVQAAVDARLVDGLGDGRTSGDLDAVCDRDVPGDPRTASDAAIAADPGAARDTGARRDGSVRAYVHVMCDLYLIIELDALFDYGVVYRAAIYGGI